MKKRFKTKLKKTTAAILVAITLIASGGYKVITNIFGIHKKDNKTIDFSSVVEEGNPRVTNIIEGRPNNIELTKMAPKTKNYQYKHTPQYFQKEKTMFEIETTEAISQTENINRLIRKRRKETREKTNI